MSPGADGALAALESAARQFPGKTALRRGADALTYAGLLREIESRAAAIASRKGWGVLDASDPVAFVLDFFAASAPFPRRRETRSCSTAWAPTT